MTAKVLLLRWGGSAYDSLDGLLRLTGRVLVEAGCQVEGVDIDQSQAVQKLPALLNAGKYDFALTLSGIGSDIYLDDKRLLWDAAQVPLFNWNCDHPAYFPRRHVIRSRYLIHGYVFPDHARYAARHLNPNSATFAAHLGVPPRAVFGDGPRPASQRNGRIVFNKTGRDINQIEAGWNARLPVVRNILFQTAESVFHSNTVDFLPALQRTAEAFGVFLDGSGELALALIRELDAYTRFKRSDMVVRALLRHKVDICGTGWEHLATSEQRARFLGPATWNDMLERLPHYLGCLSLNPLVDESVHDRVFFGLAAGVVPISDSNAFSRNHLAEVEPYAFTFDRVAIEQAVDAVLSNPDTALDRTEAAYRTAADPFGLRMAALRIAQFTAMRWGNAQQLA